MNKEIISLSIPAKAEYLITLRLVASSVAGLAGFDIDGIEEFKTALSEACLLLMPETSQADLFQISFWKDAGVHARVRFRTTTKSKLAEREREFATFMLEALTDIVEFSKIDDDSEYHIYKALPM
ncbi:MAG TPA: hypothetical protein PLH38_03685 [Clostridia bacterium]|nr:hypothetical protein [Clostridia bacterium]